MFIGKYYQLPNKLVIIIKNCKINIYLVIGYTVSKHKSVGIVEPSNTYFIRQLLAH